MIIIVLSIIVYLLNIHIKTPKCFEIVGEILEIFNNY